MRSDIEFRVDDLGCSSDCKVRDVATHGLDGLGTGRLELGHGGLSLLGDLGLRRSHLGTPLFLGDGPGLLEDATRLGTRFGDRGVVVAAHLFGGGLRLLGGLEIGDLLGATLLAHPQQRWQQPVPHEDPQREERHRAPEDLPDGVGDDGVDVGGIRLGRKDEY